MLLPSFFLRSFPFRFSHLLQDCCCCQRDRKLILRSKGIYCVRSRRWCCPLPLLGIYKPGFRSLETGDDDHDNYTVWIVVCELTFPHLVTSSHYRTPPLWVGRHTKF